MKTLTLAASVLLCALPLESAADAFETSLAEIAAGAKVIRFRASVTGIPDENPVNKEVRDGAVQGPSNVDVIQKIYEKNIEISEFFAKHGNGKFRSYLIAQHAQDAARHALEYVSTFEEYADWLDTNAKVLSKDRKKRRLSQARAQRLMDERNFLALLGQKRAGVHQERNRIAELANETNSFNADTWVNTVKLNVCLFNVNRAISEFNKENLQMHQEGKLKLTNAADDKSWSYENEMAEYRKQWAAYEAGVRAELADPLSKLSEQDKSATQTLLKDAPYNLPDSL